MAQQVEGISVRLLANIRQFVEADTTCCERPYDLGALCGVCPLFPERRRGWAKRPDRLRGVIGIAHDPELLAIRVQLVNQVSRHLDLAAVKVELSPLFCRRLDDLWFALAWWDRLGFGFRDGHHFAVRRDLLFCDPSRVAVEQGVSEQPGGRPGVVKDVEPELAVIVADARAAANDLLELAHRTNHTGKDDVLAGGRVHSSCKQL